MLHSEQLPFKQPVVRSTLEKYLEAHPLLACRTAPCTNFSGLFLPRDVALRQDALRAILDVTLDIVRTSKASFALFDYLEAGDLALDWGRFTPLKDFLDIGTRLEVSWDFNGYLESLRAQSLTRRKWLKRNLKKALESGIEIRFDRIPEIDEAVRLHQNVEKQYGEVPYTHTREVVTEARNLPGSVWMTAYHEGKMVSSELLLHDAANEVCIPTLYGRDQVDSVYFYTYYEVVRYAIEQLKVRRVVGNSGAYEFKHHLGFEPDPRNNLVFASASGLLQSMGSLISRMAG